MKHTRRDFLRTSALLTLFGQRARAQAAWAGLNAIDRRLRAFVQHENVSAAQIAIVRHGTLQFSKVYASAPPAGFEPYQQNLFRLPASCSKLFTCAAIETLRTRGLLHLHDRVFPLLGIHAAGCLNRPPLAAH